MTITSLLAAAALLETRGDSAAAKESPVQGGTMRLVFSLVLIGLALPPLVFGQGSPPQPTNTPTEPTVVTASPLQIPARGTVHIKVKGKHGVTTEAPPRVVVVWETSGPPALTSIPMTDINLTKVSPNELEMKVSLPDLPPGSYRLDLTIGQAPPTSLRLRVVSTPRVAWSAGAPVFLLLVIASAAAYIRRRTVNPLVFIVTPDGRRYSLAKLQMFLWTLVVAYLAAYVWLATNRLPVLNDQVLALMGIATATSVAAKGIGVVKGDRQAVTKQDAREPQLIDILMEENELSLIKLQMLFWTAFMAGAVLRATTRDLDYPTIDSTLLILMGISQGTYLAGEVADAVSAGKAPFRLATVFPDHLPVDAPGPVTVTGIGLSTNMTAELIPKDRTKLTATRRVTKATAAGDQATVTIEEPTPLAPGIYDLQLTDPLGKTDRLVAAITIE